MVYNNILMQFMKIHGFLDIFILFIICIKLLFLITSYAHIILIHFDTKIDPIWDENFIFWKNRTEFAFMLCMSIILIIVFNPKFNYTGTLDTEMKLLLCLFGWICIFNAKWEIFFPDSQWLATFKKYMT